VKTAAVVISFIFHPLLLTTYMVLLLGIFFPTLLGINPAVLYKFTLFVFMVTFIFPGLCMILMIRFSGASSLMLPSRRERVAPFILMALMYSAVAGLFFYKDILGDNFSRLMLVVAALVVTTAVITFFYKVSVHSLALGGYVGALLALDKVAGDALIVPTVAVILIAGTVMSSRLLLNAHTLREVMAGAGTGLAVGLGGMMILF
jgi:hypothetical protein